MSFHHIHEDHYKKVCIFRSSWFVGFAHTILGYSLRRTGKAHRRCSLYEENPRYRFTFDKSKKTLCILTFSANPDSADIETLKAQLEDVTSQLAEMKVRAETAESELEKLKSQSEEEVKPEAKVEE